MSRSIAQVIGGLTDLLVPPTCCICKSLLHSNDSAVCSDCLNMFEPLEYPVCDLCGQPSPNLQPCLACRNHDGLKIKIRSVFLFGGTCKDAVIAFKLAGKTQLAPIFAKLMDQCRLQGVEIRDFDLLVPVPLHRSRLIKRGFNQAGLIAYSLSKLVGVSVESQHLKKLQKNPSQHTLPNRKKRLRNVVGSFKVSNPKTFLDKNCCLIDDVVTTGSTLTSCADALYEAGAKSVVGVTVARTLQH